MVDEAWIVRKFMNEDLHITPEALSLLHKRPDCESASERVLMSLRKMDDKPLVVTEEIVTKILEAKPEGIPSPPQRLEPPKVEFREMAPPAKEPLVVKPELARLKFRPQAADIEPRVEVLQDITGRSYSEGELKDFVQLFKDRYERLSKLLQKRVDLHDFAPMGSLSNYRDGESVKIIGMVTDKRETRSRNILLEMEDLSGRAVVLVHKNRRELVRKAAEVITDEVIGITATVRIREGTPLLLANDIIWPDLPTPRQPARAEEPVCAVLLSDLHVGSEMFLEDAFMKFLKWLRGEVGNPQQRELAGMVKYVIIAGDLVDGVGIYPRQEEELLIHDIFKQYDAVTELLAQIPEHITVVMAPGNHDAVRPSEPQPALPRDVAAALYDLNSVIVGNPAWLSIHGVKFLIYHGRSFDDLIGTIPGLDRRDPIPPMIKLLQKRHLAPMYGERVAVAPEERDYLVIEDVPDVLHCGHMHVYGCASYRDTLLVNSGTFQEITIYMKSLGVKPTPGIVPVLNLQTGHARVMRFA
jgi:DNA polymerase II small subunit